MRRLTPIVVALVGLCVLGPATALASGPGSSAGDQQYVDPFGSGSGQTPPAPSDSSGSASPSSSTPPSSATSSPASAAPAPSHATAGPSAPTAPAAPTATTASTGSAAATATTATGVGSSVSQTLPFTGLNAWLTAVLGLALAGAGFLLRRTLLST